MFKYDVYIAGAMHGRSVGEVLAERSRAKYFCKLNGLVYYDPSEDEHLDGLSPDTTIDSKPNIQRMQWYVEKDERAIDKCAMLLVLTGDKSSSGTAWEMGRMHFLNKRPVVVIAPKMVAGKLTNFTTIKATKIFSTQEAAIKWIANEIKYSEAY
jgi:nucleoside 2-deoxyribosyltransferase